MKYETPITQIWMVCYLLPFAKVGQYSLWLFLSLSTIQHSCRPNLFVQNVFVDSHDLRFPWVAFFAAQWVKTCCLKASARCTTHRSYDPASHEQSCEQTRHTTQADSWAPRLAHAHFTFCHRKCAIEVQDSREDLTCQILTSGPTSQSRDWRTCVHGDVTHASQLQLRSRATESHVVCGALYTLKSYKSAILKCLDNFLHWKGLCTTPSISK